MVDVKEAERFPDLQYSLLATSDHVKHAVPIASRIPGCLNRTFNTSLLKALDTPVIKVIARALPLHYPSMQKEEEDMGTQTEGEVSLHGEMNTLIRRSKPDRSQRIRNVVQWLFVALNGWLGVRFFLWVSYFERGGEGLYVPRPAGAEGWLPIAGLMNFKYFLLTGLVPSIHPAAMFLFVAFLLMSLILKKAFCAWLPAREAPDVREEAGHVAGDDGGVPGGLGQCLGRYELGDRVHPVHEGAGGHSRVGGRQSFVGPAAQQQGVGAVQQFGGVARVVVVQVGERPVQRADLPAEGDVGGLDQLPHGFCPSRGGGASGVSSSSRRSWHWASPRSAPAAAYSSRAWKVGKVVRPVTRVVPPLSSKVTSSSTSVSGAASYVNVDTSRPRRSICRLGPGRARCSGRRDQERAVREVGNGGNGELVRLARCGQPAPPGPQYPARRPGQQDPVCPVPHLSATLRGQFTENLGMHGPSSGPGGTSSAPHILKTRRKAPPPTSDGCLIFRTPNSHTPA